MGLGKPLSKCYGRHTCSKNFFASFSSDLPCYSLAVEFIVAAVVVFTIDSNARSGGSEKFLHSSTIMMPFSEILMGQHRNIYLELGSMRQHHPRPLNHYLSI